MVNNKNFKMFTGYVGLVKNAVVYNERKPLPVSPPYVDFTASDPYVVMNDCLFYFEFNTFGLIPNGGYYIKNLCKNYQYGILHVLQTVNVYPAYTGQYWKAYPNSSS